MKRSIAGVLAGMLVGGMMLRPGLVEAQQPKLITDFSGKNITANTDYENPVSASDGDTIRYRLVITNTAEGTTVRDTRLGVTLPGTIRIVDVPTSHIMTNNATVKDNYVGLELNPKYVSYDYVAGSGTVTKNGSTQPLSPDSADRNITNGAISLGDISGGSGNALTVQFDAVVHVSAVKPNVKITPTPTPVSNASSSAVAKTSPKTGVADQFLITSLEWISLGGVGVGLRKVAGKLKQKAEGLK